MGVTAPSVTRRSVSAISVGAASIISERTDAQLVASMASAHYDYLLSVPYTDTLGTTRAAISDAVARLRPLTGDGYAYNDTVAQRPVLTATGWDFDGTDDGLFQYKSTYLSSVSRFTVPDLSDSIAGKGFTDTGITLDTSDGTFWVSNDGRSNSADVTYRAGLVNMTKTGTLIVERDLSAAYPSMTTIQGVAYDAVDDSLWFSSPAENLIRHVSAVDGSNIGSFTVTSSPNGVALNTTTNELLVGYSSGLAIYSKAGVQAATFSFGPVDCMYYDNTTGILYWASEPVTGQNFIGMFHLASRQHLGRLVLPEANALEGLVIDGTRAYVTNDSYFHSSTGTNEVIVYELGVVPTVVKYTKFILFCAFTADGAAVNARPLVVASSGGATNAGVGLYTISSSTTSLRVFANTTVGTTERSFADFTGLPDITTGQSIVVEVDFTLKEARLWLNGTAYGGTKSITNVATTGISDGLFMMAAAKFGTDEFPGIMRCGGLIPRFTNASERAALDRYLATRA